MNNEDNTADVRISNWTLATGTKPGAREVYSPPMRSTASRNDRFVREWSCQRQPPSVLGGYEPVVILATGQRRVVAGPRSQASIHQCTTTDAMNEVQIASQSATA
jgi:hypothetical protein